MAQTTYTFSRNRIYIAITIIVVLIIILLFKALKDEPPVVVNPDGQGAFLRDGKKVPISEPLGDFLREGNYTSLMLLRKDGRIKSVDPETGKDRKACGAIKDGKLVGNCNLNDIDILSWFDISILHVEYGNPNGPCKKSGGTVECDGGL